MGDDKEQWPPKFHMKEMTPREAGIFLRRLGECCKNWDGFEDIATSIIESAFKAGAGLPEGKKDD